MARVVRLLGAAFLLAGWIGLGLALALVTLDASRYEGYRPDPSELINAATLVAAVAGLLLGYVHGVRTREPGGVPGVPRRLAVLLAVAVCVTGLLASLAVANILGLDPGFAAGLMSGALTQSAAMGTATDAINGLSLPEADRARFVAHLAVADAVCYIFGYAGVILFITAVAPALLKVDLKQEALRFEQALGMSRAAPGSASAWRKF